MVKKYKNYYKCKSCGFYYKNKDLAKKCQDYCEKYKSCSLEITKNAVKI